MIDRITPCLLCCLFTHCPLDISVFAYSGPNYETVKISPEQSAYEVLIFVEKLKANQIENQQNPKALALAKLDKDRGRIKAEKLNRVTVMIGRVFADTNLFIYAETHAKV